MHFFKILPIALIFLSICSLIDASGHLLLEFTASNDCMLRIDTENSDKIVPLRMGAKRVNSFHPKGERHNITIGFSTPNGTTVSYVFFLKNTGRLVKHQFEQSNLVIIIQSTYKCNDGFSGLFCKFVETPRTTKRTSTLHISSPSTTTTTTTTTGPTVFETDLTSETPKTSPTKSPTTTTNPSIIPSSSQIVSTNVESTIIIILAVIIFSLSALIIVFGTLLITSRRPQQHIIFADKTQEFEMKTDKELAAEKKVKILMEDENVYEEIEEIRYTAAPLKSIYLPV